MYIEIIPVDTTLSDGCWVRKCFVKRSGLFGLSSEAELWFKFDKTISPPDSEDCDAYLLAIVMDAMRENRKIIIKGSVSKSLLSNLVEFQSAWSKWLPETYSQVEMIPDVVRGGAKQIDGAICAFSGGVDATFSLWRHSQSKCGFRSQNVNFCSIVHGFDIPLNDSDGFRSAKKISENTLSDLHIGLKTISTNYREIARSNWEHAFSCALVATLTNFKHYAGTCIVGSSEPYDSLVIPWGSSPITDHLLSSHEFHVIHDGASHSRTEKVQEILNWKAGVDNLRVCWQGQFKDRNCGVCEKCVRTKLNFLASNSPIPNCFPKTDIVTDIDGVRLNNQAIHAEWQQIYQCALNNRVSEPWVDKVSTILSQDSGRGMKSEKKRFSDKLKLKVRQLIGG